MTIVSRYFWLLGIVVMALNSLIYFARIRMKLKDESDQSKAVSMTKSFFFWSCLPWVVMGLGSTIGGIPTVFHFFNGLPFNPWIWSFYVSVIIVWGALIYWIFLKDGAETLIKYSDIFLRTSLNTSPGLVKVMTLLSIMGGIAALVFFFVVQVPTNPF